MRRGLGPRSGSLGTFWYPDERWRSHSKIIKERDIIYQITYAGIEVGKTHGDITLLGAI